MNRRVVLKGLGAALTLPWMESLSWAAGGKKTDIVSRTPPVRFGAVVFGNGAHPSEWWAKGSGRNMELSKSLSPLAGFREDINVLNNLRNFNSEGNEHTFSFSNFLSGVKLEKSPVPRGAESVDQLIARKAGGGCPIRSLVLGSDPPKPGVRGGAPAIYYNTISWSSSDTPIPPEIYPRQAFDRLFDSARLAEDRSVLDGVLSLSKSLAGKLAYHDRKKLDQFMTQIREVERRGEAASREGRLDGWKPSLDKPNMAPPETAIPQDTREHMKLMLDIMALAYQMDKTRVISYVMAADSEICLANYDFLLGEGAGHLHSISHHKNVPSAIEKYVKVNRFYVEMMAYFLDKLRAIDEGDGSTLLDNSMILFGSNMMDGHVHDDKQVPLVLCGRGGGRLRTGRVLDYPKDEERRLCNLYLSLMHRMGLTDETFGDSTEVLAHL
jgi:hypothetical protein